MERRKEPEISGMIVLDSIWGKVNELNTRYWVHAHIPVDKNRLILDNFTLHDVRDDKAVMNGEYRLLENRYKVNVLLENLRVIEYESSGQRTVLRIGQFERLGGIA